MRYFIYISYDGRSFHGWQIQPNASSVQEEIVRAISTILRKPIDIVGAGRTDTGVSAATMVAHFDAAELHTEDLTYKLNKFLPPSIAIQRIIRVNSTAHARFDACARTYHYYVYSKKNPFRRYFAYKLNYDVDFVKMNEAAQLLLDVDDFTSFSKLHTDTKTNICHVTKAVWTEIEPDLWRFEITADRFLRNMVRSIVGTLLEVGKGKINMRDFSSIIEARNRCEAAESVPGNALSLVDIVYPEYVFVD